MLSFAPSRLAVTVDWHHRVLRLTVTRFHETHFSYDTQSFLLLARALARLLARVRSSEVPHKI